MSFERLSAILRRVVGIVPPPEQPKGRVLSDRVVRAAKDHVAVDGRQIRKNEFHRAVRELSGGQVRTLRYKHSGAK